MSARRKSTVNLSVSLREESSSTRNSAIELEHLEQETTLVLQEIDHNLSRANAIINDKMFPILKKYAAATGKVWESVGFWKSFMEEAADIEIKAQNDKLPPQLLVAQEPQPLESPNTIQIDQIQSRRDSLYSSGSDPDTSTPYKTAPIPTLTGESNTDLTARKKGHLRLSVSPRKTTPARNTRRPSALDNFMDSSPPLPQRPVLLSDAGRQANHSSSFLGRSVPGGAESVEGSDADNSHLGHLSPIGLSGITTTPQNKTTPKTKPNDPNSANVPTPPILFSVQRGFNRIPPHEAEDTLSAQREQNQNRSVSSNDPDRIFNIEPPEIISSAPASSKRIQTPLNTVPDLLSLGSIDRLKRPLETTDDKGSPKRRNVLTNKALRESEPSIAANEPLTSSVSAHTSIDMNLDQQNE